MHKANCEQSAKRSVDTFNASNQAELRKQIELLTFSNFNEFILYRLKEKRFAEEYPNELAGLLNHIINKESINCIQYHGSELEEIIEKIIGMNIKSEELKELLEKLVNNNFEWAILLLKSLNT